MLPLVPLVFALLYVVQGFIVFVVDLELEPPRQLPDTSVCRPNFGPADLCFRLPYLLGWKMPVVSADVLDVHKQLAACRVLVSIGDTGAGAGGVREQRRSSDASIHHFHLEV